MHHLSPQHATDDLQSATVYWRCKGLADEGRLTCGSRSERNHPLLLVAYKDHVQAFIKRLGDNWVNELYKEENVADIKVLYRMTSDLRGLNT